MTKPIPVRDPKTGAWTVPEGYAHPRCKGCGHNYFDAQPRPRLPNGNAPDGGLCHWCISESSED